MTVFLRQLSVQLSGLLNDFVGLPVARLRIRSILKLPSWRQAQPLIAGFALALFAIGPALADGYKLGPQDKLRLGFTNGARRLTRFSNGPLSMAISSFPVPVRCSADDRRNCCRWADHK